MNVASSGAIVDVSMCISMLLGQLEICLSQCDFQLFQHVIELLVFVLELRCTGLREQESTFSMLQNIDLLLNLRLSSNVLGSNFVYLTLYKQVCLGL